MSDMTTQLARAIVRRVDSWANTLTGLGSAMRDKVLSHLPQLDTRLDDSTLEALYTGDDLAARCVDKLPREALKHGFAVYDRGSRASDASSSADEAKILGQALRDIVAADRFLEGAVWGRLYGGAALILGVDDGQTPDKPLREDRIKSFRYLTVVDKRELVAATYYSDVFAPKFGEVELYRLSPVIVTTGVGPSAKMSTYSNTLIHESRLIFFGGVLTEKRRRRGYNGFDDSVLQRVFAALQQSNSNWQSVTHLMSDAGQGVFRLKNLMQMIANGQQSLINDRMQIVDMGRSVARAILLDADQESFERAHTNFAGLPELVQQTWQRLAAAVEMPVSILMGMSPAGLNATGEADTREWYDSVRAYREQKLQPKLERVAYLMAVSLKLKNPSAWGVRFQSLWQQSPLEEADRRLKIAQTDEIYQRVQAATGSEIALSRWGTGEYSGDMQVDLDARRKMLPTEIKKLGEPAPALPPAP